MRGAGGTRGGEFLFLGGILMMVAGFYLLLNGIVIDSRFSFGTRLYGMGGVGITSGMIMIPFVVGVGLLFYNARNLVGWLLATGAVVALIVGVLASSRFSLRAMSAFELIVILVLAFGGLGLFLRSLRENPL